MILDGVLADRSVTWLGSEREKRRYFKQRLGEDLRDDEYPRLVFGKRPNVTVRYFPDKLPIGYDRAHRRHVFMYLARSRSPMDFRVFTLRHLELLNALGFWSIRVLFPRSLAGSMEAYGKAACELLTKPLTPSETEELIWFFRQSQPSPLDASPQIDPVCKQLEERFAARDSRQSAGTGSRKEIVPSSWQHHRWLATPLTVAGRSVECLELPHAYEHLFVLARQVARKRSQIRGMKLSG